MKKLNSQKQRGFFDLGLAVAILASSGIAVYTMNPDNAQDEYVQQEQIKTVVVVNSNKDVIDSKQAQSDDTK